MAQSGPGKIRLWNDFCGPEIPVTTAVAYGTTAGGCNYYLGDFAVKGDLAQTDRGVLGLGVTSGAVRIDGGNQDDKGIALCTDAIFQPSLNSPIILEARVQMAALTTRVIFVGFSGTLVDDVAEVVAYSAGTTHTLSANHLAGFVLDSQYSSGTYWHACYNGGETTGETDSDNTITSVAAVAEEWDVLRVEMYANGTVEYWINGKREFKVTEAVSTTTLQAGLVGCWGTTGTVSSLDVDYLLIEANRDWTR